MRRARVEPDVENVELLAERAGATLTGVAGGQKIRCRSIEPRIRSLGAKILADLLEKRRTRYRLVALLAVENGDWNAPESLPRDDPIRTVVEHSGHPLLPPGRN